MAQRNCNFIFSVVLFCCLEAFDQHLNQCSALASTHFGKIMKLFLEFKATVMKFDLKIKIEIPPSNYDRHCWRGGPKVFPTFVMVVMAFKPSVELEVH